MSYRKNTRLTLEQRIEIYMLSKLSEGPAGQGIKNPYSKCSLAKRYGIATSTVGIIRRQFRGVL